MSNAYYDLYLRKVFDLAKTLVVKNAASASAINLTLTQNGQRVEKSDPTTWKYYQNIAGIYHATDTAMTVVSMDTLQEINFTKEALRIHRATAREYTYGSRYYNELLRRYPDQESLILGIINPVEISRAISAADGTILQYDKNLVEENEVNLIKKLEDWIKGFNVRWNVVDYSIVDDLYMAGFLGVMFSYIPSVILNLRLAACKTNEAHSFHIREYLTSNGKLEGYIDLLTKKQDLFLYRNLRYIHRNAGRASTFELLVKKILTDRGIPLAAYEMRHNLAQQPEDLYATIDLMQVPLNKNQTLGTSKTRSVNEILIKETDSAKGNEEIRLESIVKITEAMQNSKYDRLQTKVLESDLVDLSDSAPFSFSDTLLNQWMWMSCNARYPTILGVSHPVTGARIAISAKDAFALFIWSYNKARGLDLELVPAISANRVKRVPMPTKEELKGIVESKYVSDAVIDFAMDNQPAIGQCISTESFFNLCVEIHAAMLSHRNLYALVEHQEARGQTEAMVGRFYHDPVCVLQPTGTTYAQFLSTRGLDFDTLTSLECDLLAIDLLKTATGVALNNTKSLRELQSAMMKIMEQLSSYSIQFLKTINTSAFKVVDWAAIRVGDDRVTSSDLIYVESDNIYVQDVSSKYLDDFDADGANGGLDIEYSAKSHGSDEMDPTVDFIGQSLGASSITGDIPTVWFYLEDEDNNSTPLDLYVIRREFDGLSYPNIMLENIVTDRRYDGLVYPWVPLEWIVKTREYEGLIYPLDKLVDKVFGPMDGFKYPFAPLTVPVTEFTGLTYPVLDLAASIEVRDYEELTYPAISVVSAGFTYPTTNITLPGFNYPTGFDSWIDWYSGEAFIDFEGDIDFGDNLDFIE